MNYLKFKREKTSICNICGAKRNLSWDHVPPKGSLELKLVEIKLIHSIFAGEGENNRSESQNGLKFRTICAPCNSYLGSQYDVVLNEFTARVSDIVKSRLVLPNIINVKTKPQRLMKGILGHLLSAKVDIENTSFDQVARKYVLDSNAKFPHGLTLFYWVFPYQITHIIREFAMFTPRGTYNEAAVFQLLKYFPVAYLCATVNEYANLDNISQFGDCELDAEFEIPIKLMPQHDRYWPEAPTDDGNVLFGGQSAMKGVTAKPLVRGKLLKRKKN